MSLVDNLLKGKEQALQEIDRICAAKAAVTVADRLHAGRIVVLSTESATQLRNELKSIDRFKANSLAKAGKKVVG